MEKEKDNPAKRILSDMLVKTTEWEGEAATSEIIDREAAVASVIFSERNKVADEIAAATTALDASEKTSKGGC